MTCSHRQQQQQQLRRWLARSWWVLVQQAGRSSSLATGETTVTTCFRFTYFYSHLSRMARLMPLLLAAASAQELHGVSSFSTPPLLPPLSTSKLVSFQFPRWSMFLRAVSILQQQQGERRRLCTLGTRWTRRSTQAANLGAMTQGFVFIHNSFISKTVFSLALDLSIYWMLIVSLFLLLRVFLIVNKENSIILSFS